MAAKTQKENLSEIMMDLLKDVFWAEKHLSKALPKLAKAAHDSELKKLFEKHQEETEGQIQNLEQCFELLGKKPVGKKCPAMEGLVEEGKEAIEEFDAGPARDAALIASAQKAEHYEISTYGTLRTMANVIGHTKMAKIFEKIKEQEVAADEKLTKAADRINELACQPEMADA